MHSTSDSDINARIKAYWNRRSTLSESEWADFFRVVIPFLMRTRLPAEYSDPARREALVMDFFQDKILLNAETSQAGPLTSTLALHGFLQNYERDMRRKAPEEEVLDDGLAEPDRPDRHADVLGAAGINVGDAIRSAERFVEGLEVGEQAYLKANSCADGKPEPVINIAQRYSVRNHHQRAKQLGITLSKGETYRGYEKTKIGAWLVSLGCRIDPDWREELAALLILLCRQVRLRHLEAR